ncbi:hypothetical protein Q8W37_06115 [Shimia thalassica]|nr:hypothetical protein [Shimia thalassica]MDP2579497.1 hypothetical protein [Shimia thalassica]
MPNAAKIATCNYCGTRAALVLRGETRHELTCASCGAPLHDLKQMPLAHSPKQAAAPSRSAKPYVAQVKSKKSQKKKNKKRKGWARKMAEEIFDVVEDIFD